MRVLNEYRNESVKSNTVLTEAVKDLSATADRVTAVETRVADVEKSQEELEVKVDALDLKVSEMDQKVTDVIQEKVSEQFEKDLVRLVTEKVTEVLQNSKDGDLEQKIDQKVTATVDAVKNQLEKKRQPESAKGGSYGSIRKSAMANVGLPSRKQRPIVAYKVRSRTCSTPLTFAAIPSFSESRRNLILKASKFLRVFRTRRSLSASSARFVSPLPSPVLLCLQSFRSSVSWFTATTST
jgi:methyl coenzyme M reductase subunit D